MFLKNNAGIEQWDKLEAIYFIKKNKKKPLISDNFWMLPYVRLILLKSATEQGQLLVENIKNYFKTKKIPEDQMNTRFDRYFNESMK